MAQLGSPRGNSLIEDLRKGPARNSESPQPSASDLSVPKPNGHLSPRAAAMLHSIGPGPLRSPASELPILQLRGEQTKSPSTTATHFPPSQSREQLLEELHRAHEKGLLAPRTRSYVAKKPQEIVPEVAAPASPKPLDPVPIPEQRKDLKVEDVLPTPAVIPPTPILPVVSPVLPVTPPLTVSPPASVAPELPVTAPVTPAPEKDHLREQIAALPKDLQEPAVRFIKSMNEAKTLQEIIAARKPLHTLILSLPDRDAARFAINGLTIGDNKVPMSEFLLERIVTVSASEVNTFIEEVKSAKDLRQLSLIERKMLLIDWNTYEYQGFAAAFEAKMPGIKWDQFIISARDALRSAPK